MNPLDNLEVKARQLNSLLYLAEDAMLEAYEDSSESKKRFADIFYIIMEYVETIVNSLEEVAGHRRVVSAIEAVNHVKELEAENERLKAHIVAIGI